MKLPELASINTLYTKNVCNHSTTLCLKVCFSITMGVSSMLLASNYVTELVDFFGRGAVPQVFLCKVTRKTVSKMSSTASDFCQCQCLWQIWKMSAVSFTSCSWTSSSKVQLCSFFLCTFPSVMGSCPPSSSQAFPTSGLSDSCCAPCPTLDQCLHPLLMTSTLLFPARCVNCDEPRNLLVKFW